MTASEKIISRLAQVEGGLAVHELKIIGVSDNAAATRLSELSKLGKVSGKYQPGKRYKVWSINQLGAAPRQGCTAQDLEEA